MVYLHKKLQMKKHRILIWITIFAISMGIFEGAVVVYLRELYYPEGFGFPLNPIGNRVAIAELIRELASLFMLLSVGIIAGKNFSQRFAWFIYSFAVWDIVYYIFLFAILQWPESLLTWDLLFLLPVIWTGPVITPILLSVIMIFLALLLYQFNGKMDNKATILRHEWTLLITGSAIVFISFIWDYCVFLFTNISLREIIKIKANTNLFELSQAYVPIQFPWIIYWIGFSILSLTIYFMHKRLKKSIKDIIF
jgi:hypothetical protein